MKKPFANLPRRAASAAAALAALTLSPQAWAADRITLKVVKVDSEETSAEDGKGANAVDGDPATIWVTQWQDASPPPPHEILIVLSEACRIIGFTYLPRQDASDNGTIKDYEFYVGQNGKEFGRPVKKGTFEGGKERKVVTFEPRSCRFIKLKALSEINGQPWTSAAEIGIIREGEKVRVKPTLKVVKVDSEETSAVDGKGANAVDGDPNTIWVTQWQEASPPPPHEIIIELRPPCAIKGFTYLPRQDASDKGTIKDYEFYVSNDGKDFGKPVKTGAFEDGKERKTVTFAPRSCRFIKLKALSEINDQPWTSAAEIGVLAE
jgi:hypothetical protein